MTVAFIYLPMDVHTKVAAQTIIDGCYPSSVARDYDMVLPLATVSNCWKSVVLLALEHARREIGTCIDLLVADLLVSKPGDKDSAAFDRFIL